MKIKKQKDRQKDRQADDVAPAGRGKRIRTPADVLIQNRWIALHVSQDVHVDSTQPFPTAKPSTAMELKQEEDKAAE